MTTEAQRVQDYLRPSISNGCAREQAMIRSWWYDQHDARGRIVWEYYLEGRYADAIWFPNAAVERVEENGRSAPKRFPVRGETVVLCEAKAHLSPDLIRQALVYSVFAANAEARVEQTVVFADKATRSMIDAARQLGLGVVVHGA